MKSVYGLYILPVHSLKAILYDIVIIIFLHFDCDLSHQMRCGLCICGIALVLKRFLTVDFRLGKLDLSLEILGSCLSLYSRCHLPDFESFLFPVTCLFGVWGGTHCRERGRECQSLAF
jgi:hypothetical protein